MSTILLRTTSLLVVAATIALAGHGLAGHDVAAQQTPSSSDALRPGDLIRLFFSRDPDLNGDYLIDESGNVSLPLIGLRHAVSLPPEAFRQQLIADLSKELRNQEPVVTVLRRVRILGAVQSPGLYHVDRTMTLGDVVALAEGITSEGQLNQIRIVRNGQTILTDLDTTSPIAQAIQSGDQILVPKAGWFTRNGRWLVGGVISATAIVIAAVIR